MICRLLALGPALLALGILCSGRNIASGEAARPRVSLDESAHSNAIKRELSLPLDLSLFSNAAEKRVIEEWLEETIRDWWRDQTLTVHIDSTNSIIIYVPTIRSCILAHGRGSRNSLANSIVR
jgi:hypothetical protein